jgi:hypothetical protein
MFYFFSLIKKLFYFYLKPIQVTKCKLKKDFSLVHLKLKTIMSRSTAPISQPFPLFRGLIALLVRCLSYRPCCHNRTQRKELTT